MPPKTTYRKKRAPARRRKMMPRRRKGNVADVASLSVKKTITQVGGLDFNSGIMYEVHNIRLADYDRAVTVAQAYQHYRIKQVSLTFKFPYDTYQAGAGLASRPNFYYMVDKSQSIPLTITLEGLKQMGARPRPVDDKPLTVRWGPSVLTETQAGVPDLASQYKISPWLSTNANNIGAFAPSTVNHNGLYWFADQQFGPGIFYQAELEVQFEFKKPLWTKTLSATPARGITLAVEDGSPDGVVGGGDSHTQ